MTVAKRRRRNGAPLLHAYGQHSAPRRKPGITLISSSPSSCAASCSAPGSIAPLAMDWMFRPPVIGRPSSMWAAPRLAFSGQIALAVHPQYAAAISQQFGQPIPFHN